MGCQWASSDSGEEVALRWGEGGVKKRGWAKLERFSAGRKAVEKKKYPTLGLIGSLVSFSGNKESEREPNTKLLGCCKISGLSLSLFFFFLVEGGHLTTVLSTAPKKEKWAVLYKWSDCQTKIECVFFTPKALLHNLVLFPQAAEVILVLKSCPV